MDLKHWLHGLVATIINGCASGVVLIIAEPEHFNIHEGRYKLLSVSAVMGIVAAANYLKSSPLPEKLR